MDSPQNQQHPEEIEPFQIGLVMAGAVSAGAYTGGVMDFLVQALDEWYAEKDAAPPAADVPPHEVRLSVMSGASAGGMCAAITTVSLGEVFAPVLNPETATGGNKLFEAWVNQIDIDPLLKLDDLITGRPPLSALNGNILDRIRNDAFGAAPAGRARPFVADPLHVLMTTTNLRGVPYHLVFQDGTGEGERPHYMMMHADFVHFEVAGPPKAGFEFAGGAPRRGIPLLRTDLPDGGYWKLFGEVALATGAFPIGLPPRQVSVPPEIYNDRDWRVTTKLKWTDDKRTKFETTGELQGRPPSWPDPRPAGSPLPVPPPSPFEYISVDGGAMDNEPVELARSLLPRNDDGRRVDGLRSTLVMIDPFPDSANPAASEAALRFAGFAFEGELLHLGHLVTRMLRSFIEQARFKPEEIARADNPDIYDSYLLAPNRVGPDLKSDRGENQSKIACGALGGFGGFLDEAFRRHDYQLGRRNCWEFLKCHFSLPLYDPHPSQDPPERTPLFAHWSPAAIKKHLIVRPIEGKKYKIPLTGKEAEDWVVGLGTDRPVSKDPKKFPIFLPIIPLRGTAVAQPALPKWPTLRTDRNKKVMRKRIKTRLDAVLDHAIAGMDGFFTKRAFYLARWFKSGDVTDQILKTIEDDLKKEELLAGPW